MTRLALFPLLAACSREDDPVIIEVTCASDQPVDTASPPGGEAEAQSAATYVEWTDSGIMSCDRLASDGLVAAFDTSLLEAWALIRVSSSGGESFVLSEDVAVEDDGISYLGDGCYSELAIYLRLKPEAGD